MSEGLPLSPEAIYSVALTEYQIRVLLLMLVAEAPSATRSEIATKLRDARAARVLSAGWPVERTRWETERAKKSPNHAAVSWTYMPAERAEEALLRIRRLLKESEGWWTENDARLEREAFVRLGLLEGEETR